MNCVNMGSRTCCYLLIQLLYFVDLEGEGLSIIDYLFEVPERTLCINWPGPLNAVFLLVQYWNTIRFLFMNKGPYINFIN